MGIWEWLQGNPEKKYRERFPERKKPSEPPADEPEESTPAPEPNETDEPTPESTTEENVESPDQDADETAEELSPKNPSAARKRSASEPTTKELEEPPIEPKTEDVKPSAPEAVADEMKETASEPTTKEPEEEPHEPTTETPEEPSSEPVAEETSEPVSEPMHKEAEPPIEPVREEPGELISEIHVEKREKPVRKPSKFGTLSSFLKRKPKTKKKDSVPKPSKFGTLSSFLKRKPKTKKKESTAEPEFFKLLILPTTLASMLLGLSIMPLFPQPLPAILAFLIAFVAYKKPRIGMPIGGLTIGLGLMYNLSKMNFISMLGSTELRGAFVFVLLFLFTALPVIFQSRRAVISINLGIIAAILLFFSQTYFLAIPLIFTAVVLFKKLSFLTVLYYLLISVPMQIMQYLNLVLPIERWDWWIEPGTSPPIYVPLTEIFTNVQESMLQFRLYDTSKVVYAISDQITLDPPLLPHTIQEMISHYLDSMPGIVMFLFMVIGIVLALVFFTRTFLAKSNMSYGERLLPIMSATVGVALFFILAASLQGALAFRVDINSGQIALATFATLLFTMPTLLIDYTPKRRATVDMIMEKSKDLKAKLAVFEDELDEVKRSLPISTGQFEVKAMMLRDRLNDVLSKASMRLENTSEIDKIFSEIDSLSKDIDNLSVELNVAVREYQVFVNCECSKWIGMFKDIGLETNVTMKTDFQDDVDLDARIAQIKGVLDEGSSLANEIIRAAKQAYDVIRSFYDPDLPVENRSITFAQKKLCDKETPWVALDALFNALNNWNKQYKSQISMSIGHLLDALSFVAAMRTETERLQLVLGDDFSRMMENVRKAENVKTDIEERALNVVNALTVKDVFQRSFGIVKDVLLILDENVKRKEKAIERLAPSEDFSWEKNDTLRKRLASAVEITSKTSDAKLGDVLKSLPKFLGYVGESIEMIAVYNHTEELLLNYPIVERAVEKLLTEKNRISVEDLPFESQYSEEYLKLFYSQKFPKYSLDRANMLLTKKT